MVIRRKVYTETEMEHIQIRENSIDLASSSASLMKYVHLVGVGELNEGDAEHIDEYLGDIRYCINKIDGSLRDIYAGGDW